MSERDGLLAKMGLAPGATTNEIKSKHDKLLLLFKNNLRSADEATKEKALKNLKLLDVIYRKLIEENTDNDIISNKTSENNFEQADSKAVAPLGNDEKFCVKCSNIIKKHHRFCDRCGTPITVIVGKNRLSKKAVICSLFMILIAAVGVFFYFNNKGTTGTQTVVKIVQPSPKNIYDFKIDARNYQKLKDSIDYIVEELDQETGFSFMSAMATIAAEANNDLFRISCTSYITFEGQDLRAKWASLVKASYIVVMERQYQSYLDMVDGKTVIEILEYSGSLIKENNKRDCKN